MAHDYEIRDATIDDVLWVAMNIRHQDYMELQAQTLFTPIEGLVRTFEESPWCKVGLVDGEPACVFGVAMTSLLLGGLGQPWMVGTPLIEKHAKAFLRRNEAMVLEMQEQANILENYVDARNETAIKWLQWLGFTLEPAAPYGMLQRLFHRFTWRRR